MRQLIFYISVIPKSKNIFFHLDLTSCDAWKKCFWDINSFNLRILSQSYIKKIQTGKIAPPSKADKLLFFSWIINKFMCRGFSSSFKYQSVYSNISRPLQFSLFRWIPDDENDTEFYFHFNKIETQTFSSSIPRKTSVFGMCDVFLTSNIAHFSKQYFILQLPFLSCQCFLLEDLKCSWIAIT